MKKLPYILAPGLLFVLIGLIVCFVLLMKTNSKMADLQIKVEKNASSMSALEERLIGLTIKIVSIEKGFVDLTTSSIQDIGDGFCVVDIEVSEHLAGVNVKGRIINTTSVTHKGLSFIINISEFSNSFTITRIKPGNSTRFIVYVPDVKPVDVKFGTIKYQRSTVIFRTR